MSTDTRIARLAELRQASGDVYEAYEATVKELVDENAALAARLDECRRSQQLAFGLPGEAKQPVGATVNAKKPQWKPKPSIRPCERCKEPALLSKRGRFCRPCFRALARERMGLSKTSSLAAVS